MYPLIMVVGQKNVKPIYLDAYKSKTFDYTKRYDVIDVMQKNIKPIYLDAYKSKTFDIGKKPSLSTIPIVQNKTY